MGRILKRYCKAYPVEIEKLFVRIIFNYVVSNGDAHLKNFQLERAKVDFAKRLEDSLRAIAL